MVPRNRYISSIKKICLRSFVVLCVCLNPQNRGKQCVLKMECATCKEYLQCRIYDDIYGHSNKWNNLAYGGFDFPIFTFNVNITMMSVLYVRCESMYTRPAISVCMRCVFIPMTKGVWVKLEDIQSGGERMQKEKQSKAKQSHPYHISLSVYQLVRT